MSQNLGIISESLENLKKYTAAFGNTTNFSDLEKKIKRSIAHILERLNRLPFSVIEKVEISTIMKNLSRQISEFAQDKEGGNKLAAEVQAVAQSLLPPPEKIPTLPDEMWEEIFARLDLIDIRSGRLLTIDKTRKNVFFKGLTNKFEKGLLEFKNIWKTAEKALKFAGCINLSRINLKEFQYISVENLVKLIKGNPEIRTLSLPPIPILPKEIFNLKNLQELEIYTLQTKFSLSKEIENLKKLQKLTIKGKKIELPKELGNLKELKELVIEVDPPYQLPTELNHLALTLDSHYSPYSSKQAYREAFYAFFQLRGDKSAAELCFEPNSDFDELEQKFMMSDMNLTSAAQSKKYREIREYIKFVSFNYL